MTAPNPEPPPIKVTVFLTQDAHDAVERTVEREGRSRTDTINLAVLAWDQLTAQPGKAYTLQTPGSADAAHSPSAGPGIDVTPVLDEADRILAGPLPRFGEVIRDAERLAVQLLGVLRRPTDPASAPTVQVWPSLSEDILVHDVLIAEAIVNVEYALRRIGKAAALPSPPVGSAVKVARPPLGYLGPACNQGLPTGPCDLPAGHPIDVDLPYSGHEARP